MISSVISRLFILLYGTLYPAYASFKAMKTKKVREHVKWMMYWIVFALFTCVEVFTDIFLSWFPFYYEIKIALVLWLLSPTMKGSSILYRTLVHPTLSSREREIDECISKAKDQSYKHVLDLGTKGVNVLMQSAFKNFSPLTLTSSLSKSSLRNDQQTHGVVKRSASAGSVYEGTFREGEHENYHENMNMSMRIGGVVRSKSINVIVRKSRKKTAEIEYCVNTD